MTASSAFARLRRDKMKVEPSAFVRQLPDYGATGVKRLTPVGYQSGQSQYWRFFPLEEAESETPGKAGGLNIGAAQSGLF